MTSDLEVKTNKTSLYIVPARPTLTALQPEQNSGPDDNPRLTFEAPTLGPRRVPAVLTPDSAREIKFPIFAEIETPYGSSAVTSISNTPMAIASPVATVEAKIQVKNVKQSTADKMAYDYAISAGIEPAKVSGSRGKDSYNVPLLKEFARGLGLKTSQNKGELAESILVKLRYLGLPT